MTIFKEEEKWEKRKKIIGRRERKKMLKGDELSNILFFRDSPEKMRQKLNHITRLSPGFLIKMDRILKNNRQIRLPASIMNCIVTLVHHQVDYKFNPAIGVINN